MTLPGALLLLLGAVSAAATALSYIEDVWSLSKRDNMGFNHMTMDKRTGKLYVAAVNKLFSFDSTLKSPLEVETGPKPDNPLCPPFFTVGGRTCEKNLTETPAYNKGLVIDYDDDLLIACTSLFHGTCKKYQLSSMELVEDLSMYRTIVANNASATTVLFIAPGPLEDSKGHQAKALYVGAQRTNSGTKSFRDMVPAFASRKLSDFDLVESGLASKSEIVVDAQHRDQFPVYYIYGFGSDNFSYMIVIQKQSTTSENFVTKIFRVCQKDLRFLSYAEVQLQCMHNGEPYNLVQAAHLGRPGLNLAQKLGIPDTEDVLYAVFSKSKPNSAEPLRESALCIFPMRNVRKVFTENIQACFTGTGNTGPAHIGNPSLCRNTPDLKVDDDYCGKHDVNYPIDGTSPIVAESAVKFDYTASSITVVNVSHFTVAFVGTANGRLLKIALEAQDHGILSDAIKIDDGSKINPDMFIDSSLNYLYVLTDFKLLKIKTYECSQYKTCKDCLGANDPYCGWCSLENKCSLRKDCSNNEQALRWLPYVKSCTKITSVTPPKIQKETDKITQLELNVSNLPTFDEEYQCVFSNEDQKIKTTKSRMTSGNSIILCDTPKTNMLPPIPTGEDHIVMNLTVQIGGLHFVSTKFTFYDCSTHSGCSGCTLSEYDCTWCIENHLCTHNPTGECATNKLVYGKNMLDQGDLGPDKCPRIELPRADSPDAKILVPSGRREKISVMGVNLHDFQTVDVSCYFVSLSEQVPATVTPEGDGKYKIECDFVEFTYPLNTNMSKVPFHIFWGNARTLDNPAKIQVTMYKCNVMAKSCGDCMVQKDFYKCGWCEDTCSIYDQCNTSPKRWLPNNGTCANVTITSISPVTGPKDGGTLLTILGINLGKQFSDISGGITVAGVACNPIEELYQPPHKIVCKTEPYSRQTTGTVHLTIGNLYSTDAAQRFTYVDPVLGSISPDRGPVSGGSIVTITGQNLDAGTKVTVGFDANTCHVLKRSRTQLTCVTTEANKMMTSQLWAMFDEQNISSTSSFTYVENPEIKSVLPVRAIVSGGITITVTGKHFNTIQKAAMVTRKLADTSRKKRSAKEFESDCEMSKDKSNSDSVFYCYSANVTNATTGPVSENGVKFGYGFRLNNLFIDRTGSKSDDAFTIFPDPVIEDFQGNREKSYQSKTDNYLTINGRNMALGFNSSDVTVRIGVAYCNVTSIDKHGNQLNCKPPKTQPSSAQNSKYPEVVVQVGRNLTRLVGYLKYEQPEILPLPVIIGLGVGGGILVLVVIFFFVLWCIKTRENTSMKKKWQIQMDNLEVKVAKECKEAFAELQTDMTELTSDHFGQVAIPFWDYRTYCMRVLFPQDEDSHAVIREIEVDPSRREAVEQGLKLFSQLMGNKTFLLTFVRTLEANKKFSMRDRVQVASLISVALQTRMEYATEILKTLLAELIEKAVEGKNHPKLLLRRTESVAEKMLTNWFTFLLYKFLRECAGEPLFMLYQAIKQQTCKGPVDNITFEARYSLSEDKLIRQQIDYSAMTVYVQDMDQFNQSHAVKVLDCDTISQVKEKILDAIYKNAPFSSRPARNSVDLVLFAQKPEFGTNLTTQKMILSDIDETTKQEGDFKRYNTLAHYQVPDGAYMALVAKQTSSYMDLTMNGDKYYNPKFEYKRLGAKDDSYTSTRSPSLNRTASPQNVHIDIENNSSNNGVKYYHLVKQHDQESNKEGDRGSKMVSEIYLTRLLATKGTLQQFVDDLFERIFSTIHRGTSLPLAIKYMFDFLDDQALLHNIQDADVVHTWKSNSLPLRFWVNVIKNPNFVFDIYKSNIVDSCLSVVAQNFMDSCSMSEHKLGKDSPSSKLLYAKDIPTYKKWVDRYYQDIKMMPAISDQDMTAMMAEESRSHQDEFNVNAALLELYKYVHTYQEDLREALEDDEFAKKNKLNFKLEQVRQVMEGDGYR